MRIASVLKHVLVMCVLLAAVASARGRREIVQGRATVPAFATALTMDGKISPGEWERAASVIGFQRIVPSGSLWFHRLEERFGRTYIGHTDEALYIAIVMELAPDGSLIQRYRQRDFHMNFDDQVDTNPKTGESALGVAPKRAMDVESEEELGYRNGTFGLELKGYGVRLVEFE